MKDEGYVGYPLTCRVSEKEILDEFEGQVINYLIQNGIEYPYTEDNFDKIVPLLQKFAQEPNIENFILNNNSIKRNVREIGDVYTRAVYLLVASKHRTFQVPENIQKYCFSQDRYYALRNQIAHICAMYTPNTLSHYIQNFNLSQNERYLLAKIIASINGAAASINIDNYQLIGEEGQRQRVEIAKVAASQDGKETSSRIRNYNITDADINDLLDIAKRASKHTGIEILKYMEEFNIPQEYRDELFIYALKYERAFKPEEFKDILSRYYGIELDQLSRRAFLEAVINYYKSNNLLPKNISFEETFAEYSTVHFVANILEYLIQNPQLKTQIEQLTPRQALRFIILESLGVTPNKIFMGTKYTRKNLVNIYHTYTLVKEVFGTRKVFSEINLSEEIFEKKNISEFIQFITKVAELVQMSGDKDDIKLKALIHMTQKGIIDLNFIRTNHRKLKRFVEKRLLSILQNHRVKPEYLTQISQLWGGIQTIITLASKYRGNPLHGRALERLSQIVSYTAQGRFKELKYKGDNDEAETKQQLEYLTDKQLSTWQEDSIKMCILEENTHQDRDVDEMIHLLKESLSNNSVIEREQAQVLDNLKLRNINPKQLLEEIGFMGLSKKQVRQRIMEIMLPYLSITQDSNKISEVITFILSNNLTNNEDLSQKLRAIQSKLRRKPTIQKTLLVSVITDNPHLMLQIGDLVEVPSCQNYRVGWKTETLPSYVIDANVKGLIAFNISPEQIVDLKTGEEISSLQDIQEILKQGRYKLLTDLSKRIVYLSTDTQLYQVNMGDASLRHLIKLGLSTNGKPGIALESPYSTANIFTPQTKIQTYALYEEYAQLMGITPYDDITVAQTRNPDGTYSDMYSTQKPIFGPYKMRSYKPNPLYR